MKIKMLRAQSARNILMHRIEDNEKPKSLDRRVSTKALGRHNKSQSAKQG
jgi:hypothetical protein